MTCRLLTLVAALALLAACANGEPIGNGTGEGLTPPEFELTKEAALTSFDACLDMEAYLTDLALAELLRGTSGGGGHSRGGGGAIGVDTGGGWDPAPGWGAADVASAPVADGGGWSSGGNGGSGSSGGNGGGGSSDERPADWTDTNNQTDGVAEADIVKTDGAYLYVVSGAQLRIVDAWPPEEAREVGTIALDEAPFDLFLRGDTALLFSRIGRADLPADMAEAVRADRDVHELLLVTLVDVSDRTAPRVVRTLHVEGRYVSARRVDDTAFVVARSSVSLDRSTGWDIPGPAPSDGRPDTGAVPGVADAGGGFDPDGSNWAWDVGPAPAPDTTTPGEDVRPESDVPVQPDVPPADGRAGADAGFGQRRAPLTAEEASEAVLAILARRTAEDWLPRYRSALVAEDGTEEVTSGLVVACDDVYRPSTPFGQDLLVVLAIDLADPTAEIRTQAVIGGADTVYASATSLYVAAARRNYWYYDAVAPEDREKTAIHAFALADGAAAYRASGEVAGGLLNQFALDEFEGHLRVATTTGWEWDQQRQSHVIVLGEADGRLAEVGRVDGLGRDEDLYAVRFLGDRGFVVTFRQVDPLFTLDLADPRAPRLVGELEIPGFSTYLHPMDEDHLLAIGESRSGQVGGEWFEEEWGVKLAIYDVSDLANPREIRKTVVGGASSEAQYDHHAFTWYAAQGVLAVPVSGGWERHESAVHVWDVSVADGFALRGAVDHADLGAALIDEVAPGAYCWGEPSPLVRRALFLDDVLYSVSAAGVKANPLADLADTLAVVPFDDVCALADICDLPQCWGERSAP